MAFERGQRNFCLAWPCRFRYKLRASTLKSDLRVITIKHQIKELASQTQLLHRLTQ